MNLLPDMIAAILILLICICSIKAADAFRAYTAAKAQDKFDIDERTRKATLKAFVDVLREAKGRAK